MGLETGNERCIATDVKSGEGGLYSADPRSFLVNFWERAFSVINRMGEMKIHHSES